MVVTQFLKVYLKKQIFQGFKKSNIFNDFTLFLRHLFYKVQILGSLP
jgi:hypothetical protein